ncbi:hypothetical protein ACFLVO_04115 [Chloroflexota bacterium]
MTTKCNGYIVNDKSDGGQDASLQTEMGNVNSSATRGFDRFVFAETKHGD